MILSLNRIFVLKCWFLGLLGCQMTKKRPFVRNDRFIIPKCNQTHKFKLLKQTFNYAIKY
jgi:hypothetical protein